MPRLAVTGASGFVGRHVVSHAAAQGWDVVGVVRAEAGETVVRQAGARPARVAGLTEDALARAFEGAVAVVHLAHVGAERDGATYEGVNVGGTCAVAEAADRAGALRVVMFSGLGVARYGMAPRSTNDYFLSKLRAEAELLGSAREAVVFRPSYIVGPRDGLVSSLLAQMAGGAVDHPGDALYRLQPIAVRDAAEAVMAAVRRPRAASDHPSFRHRVLDLVGPRPLAFREFIDLVAAAARAQGRGSDFHVRSVPVEEADRRARAGGWQGLAADELDCLLCDEVSDARPLEALLGRFLVPVEEAVAAAVRGTPPARDAGRPWPRGAPTR